MSETTLNEVTAAVTDDAHFNAIQDALCGNLVPRNASGVAENRAGELGTDSIKFLRAEITLGYLALGHLKYFYDYDGLIAIPQGWMLADGRQITPANYDAEAGRSPGDWNKYVGSSALKNKYLPSMDNKYLIGTTSPTQNGAGPLSFVGNPNHEINLAHTHSSPRTSSGGNDQSNYCLTSGGAALGVKLASSPHTHQATINSYLGANVNIQPKSIKAKLIMRII